MIRKISLLAGLLLVFSARGQYKSALPTDPHTFIFQLTKEMVKAGGNRPEVRMIDDTTYTVIQEVTFFQELWEQGAFDAGLEDTFIAVVNAMRQRRMTWVPDVFQVLLIVNGNTQSGIEQARTREWLSYLLRQLKRKSIRSSAIRRLNRLAYALFRYNTLVWRRGYQWRLGSEKYAWGPNNRDVIHIGPTDLLGTSPNDTLVLKDVEGNYDPLLGILEGKGGTLTWLQHDLHPNELSAQLPPRYRINLNKSSFAIDSVWLHYPERFPKPMLGRVEAKIYLRGSRKKGRYPRFSSYQAELSLRDLTPGVHYQGGFGLEGVSITGIATPTELARVVIERNGRPALELESEQIRIYPDRLLTDKAFMKILWDDETISTQNISAKIFFNSRKATFNLKGLGDFHPPLRDDYHGLLIRGRYMAWPLDSPTIHLRSLYGSVREVKFRSLNYFNEKEYDLLRGILPYDPLHRLVLMARRRQRTNFDIEEVAIEFGNETREGIIPLLVNMANEGLIDYSAIDSTITILPRAFHIVKARKGKVDYDNIRFVSQVKRGDNAVFRWDNYDLIAYGVSRIHISDSQGVILFPNQAVRIKKRLSMIFSGTFTAGLMNFMGDSFFFNYDSFYVWMPRIDAARFYYHDTSANGHVELRQISTPIQNLEGTLYIDSPNNKSGLKDNPEYPIFMSQKGGYAYYDDSTIGVGGYDPNKVYFELYPFRLDSLNALRETSIRMRGKFYSGGIFPEFETDLIVMPDHSLGFRYKTPPEGFNLYNQKGKGHLTITMDKRGLSGSGAVDYLGAHMYARWFLFTEDSMIGEIDTFYLAHNTRNIYPLTRGSLFPVRWYPPKDTLIMLPSAKHPVYVYEDSIQMIGKVVMTPQRLISYGKFTYERAEVTALTHFELQPDRVLSPQSLFRILTNKKGEYAMESRDVAITLDLKRKQAHAIANSDTSLTVFPYNKFFTTLRNYRWSLKNNQIIFDVRGTRDTSNALFTSLLPEAGGLTISSPYAIYDISNFRIHAYDVRYIEVDDSWVIPDSGKVVIEKGGKLPYLRNSVILADQYHQYHRIIQAELTIKGKYDISGKGIYRYTTITGKTYSLPVNRIFISPQDSLLRANISVPDTMRFYPHPQFQFTGSLKMVCQDPELAFDGFLKTRSQWEGLQTEWFPLQGKVDARNFRVPIASSPITSRAKSELYHGFYLAPGDFSTFYPRFLKPLLNDYDIAIATSADTTWLYYDSLQQTFILEDKKYDTLEDGIDSFYSYRLIASERDGEIALKSSNIQLLHSTPAVHPYIGGIIRKDSVLTNYYRLDLVSAFTIPLPPALMTMLGDSLANFYVQQEAIPDLNDRMLFCLENWLAPYQPHVSSEVITALEEEELWVPHEQFAPSLIFSDLKMMWNPELNMFISIDTPQLAGMNQSGVSQKVFGFVAIRPPEVNATQPDQALYIYFEPAPSFWFFIKVEGDDVGIIASDPTFLEQYSRAMKKLSHRKARVRILDFADRDVIVGQILPVVTSYYKRY